jgi:hypothetical protein
MTKPKPKTEQISAEELAALRRRCQTDLYFLAKEVLGYSKMVPHVHQAICDTYLQKDPDIPLEDLSEIKTRMILAPRGCFKTSLSMADVIQLILCYPDVRILLLTGSQDLATRMVSELKSHFETNDKLRALFPEMCPAKDARWGSSDEFTVPARKGIFREPTVSISTIASVKAGSHYDVIKCDDVQNEINSSTPDQCAKVVEAFDALGPLLNPGGFVDINGTRYKPWDLYGRLLERNAAAAREDEDSGEEVIPELKYTILAAWKFKDGIEPPRNEGGTWILTKDSVDLLFPEQLKFKYLYKQYRNNPVHFCCQYLNDPLAAQTAERPFTEPIIRQHIIPYHQIPLEHESEDFILWDLAGANPRKSADSDYCAGVVGRLDRLGRLFIIDMVRGQWTAIQQAAQIVELQKQWRSAKYTYVEDSQGTRYLEPTIQKIAQESNVPLMLRWAKVPRFAGAKRARIDYLARLFTANKLWLAGYLKYIDTLLTELLDLNPEHDDCSDAIALLVRELGLGAVPSGQEQTFTQEELDAVAERARQRGFYNALFGEGAVATAPEEPQMYKHSRLGYGR